MAFTELFQADASVSTTEYSLTNDSTTIANQTTDGLYQVLLHLSPLDALDVFDFAVHEKVFSGGTRRKHPVARLAGLQGGGGGTYVSPPFILMHGWDFTLQKIAGADQSIFWSIRQLTPTISEYKQFDQTITTTEHSFVNDSSTIATDTSDALVQLWLENNAVMAIADVYEFARYEKVYSAGAQLKEILARPAHWKVAGTLMVTPLLTLLHGWDFSGKKIAGADLQWNWSLRTVV
jgi:hypothetical protein